ncbi:MarR family transcriptional regulator [Albimonas sp. CAU 1670]|uniref:MarR family winged helix-turn-helix transcriptional regulator n=1 Tax=Albimonas sp. CAU 1670 TaxID=3032599 RepID=UPI0023DA0371|nr:MarR family transcriptional regulator [Albimonas sp. CAU 1670]MDF2232318.1 MarR family transcriptional regulator [Albimonas sp. CAU 1670]
MKSSLVALRRILRATEGSARALARETGLTTPQLMVLDHLAERAEATPKTIAQSVGVAQATATALIEKLEARGFVRRRRGETDRRQFWLSLTPEGQAALDAAPDPLQSRFAEKFDRLADWEQSMLVASLERVAALMEAADESAASDVAPLLHAGEVTEPHHEARAERRSTSSRN